MAVGHAMVAPNPFDIQARVPAALVKSRGLEIHFKIGVSVAIEFAGFHYDSVALVFFADGFLGMVDESFSDAAPAPMRGQHQVLDVAHFAFSDKLEENPADGLVVPVKRD